MLSSFICMVHLTVCYYQFKYTFQIKSLLYNCLNVEGLSLLEIGVESEVSFCCHLNFRNRTCFEQGVPWHSGNYRVYIYSKTNTWHDVNIQSISFPENIPLGEDVLKSSWRRLQDVFSVTFFCLPRLLQDIIARHLANTSWRRLAKTSWNYLEDVLGRCREDVFKMSWKTKKCYAEDVLGTKKCLLG